MGVVVAETRGEPCARVVQRRRHEAVTGGGPLGHLPLGLGLERLELLGQTIVVRGVGRQRSGRGPQGVGAHRDAHVAHRYPGARRREEETDLQVVLEVLADVGGVEVARHADRFELLLRPDAGQHEDVGRPHRSGAEHHLLRCMDDGGLAVCGPVLHAARPQLAGPVLHDHPGDVGVADHLEVRTPLDVAFEERVIGARPLAGTSRGLQERHHPVRAAAVTAVVVARGDPGRDRCVDEVLRAGEHRSAHRHAKGTIRVVRVGVDGDVPARGQPLALLEVGQDVVVAPPGGAARGPRVEVARMAPHVGHVVDTGRTAQHLAARHHHPAIGESEPAVAGVGGVHPVGGGVHLQRGAGRGHQLLRWGRTAGLQERNSTGRVLREPGSDDCAGRPTSHHDEIERLGHVRNVAATDRARRASVSASTSGCRAASRARWRG